MDEKKKLATLLRKLADQIERSSPEELQDMLTGKQPFRFARNSRIPLGARLKARPPIGKSWMEVADELRQLSTREEGNKLLDDLALSKIELEKLARMMNLPVPRQDSAERLREKIIESSIGSRLVSRAIRGD